MADLDLGGVLDLGGLLDLNPDGGKVTVDGKPALVELPPGGAAHTSSAPPVNLPPPPGGPLDPGASVWVLVSFNKTVTAGGKPIVALGMAMQGNTPTWPGMMLPGSATVTINQNAINVENDQAIIFPSGSAVALSNSGQG